VRLPIEVSVVRIDHRDRPGAEGADAADDVGVVVEDEVLETSELAVRGHVREVQGRAPLILSQGYDHTSGAANLSIEGGVIVEGLEELTVDAHRQDFGDVVVQCQTRRVVGDELIVQREPPERLQLEAPFLDDEALLDREDRLVERLGSLLLHVEGRTGFWVDLADVTETDIFFVASLHAFGVALVFDGLSFFRVLYLLGQGRTGKGPQRGGYQEPDGSVLHR